MRFVLVPDKDLLKEVTKELCQSVKKLRPDIDKDARMHLVLKALITIGDLPNPIEAAMVVAVCLEMEGEGETETQKNESEKTPNQAKEQTEDMPNGRRVVRRRSAAK